MLAPSRTLTAEERQEAERLLEVYASGLTNPDTRFDTARRLGELNTFSYWHGESDEHSELERKTAEVAFCRDVSIPALVKLFDFG